MTYDMQKKFKYNGRWRLFNQKYHKSMIYLTFILTYWFNIVLYFTDFLKDVFLLHKLLYLWVRQSEVANYDATKCNSQRNTWNKEKRVIFLSVKLTANMKHRNEIGKC